MSKDDSADPWEGFVAELAGIARLPTTQLDETSELIDDLAMDSLALAEVAAFINETYNIDLAGALPVAGWSHLTVGDVFRISCRS